METDEGVSLPWIHKHLMMPWNDLRKGDCCGLLEAISDGYYCKICDIFIHKKCTEKNPKFIQHPSHSIHPLEREGGLRNICKLCGRRIVGIYYRCEICDFDLDLKCAKVPPPDVIDISEMHHHKLTLLKERINFKCDAKCDKSYNAFPYKCHECDLAFHVDCIWHTSKVKHQAEVNHSHHSLHSLKLLKGPPPDYSDGKCQLCGRTIDDPLFYHCSSCNFSLDMRCILHPPAQTLSHSKAHDHQLTLLPRHRSFTCNACGLSGDRSPYICVQCDFIIHQDCLGLPRIININRHDHRISRTSVLGVVNSVCGVCHKKVDWACGGYSCQRCPNYVVHSKCATRDDVWNGKELEGVPEEIEDIEPYVVIDENTIQHFSHKEHNLRLYVDGLLCEENKRCNACTHPICLQSFYGCMDCDFILHQNCAELRRKKWHVLHNDRLTLVTSKAPDCFECGACHRLSNGFRYEHGGRKIDVRCSSVTEPFFHPSHHHPLYSIAISEKDICDGCTWWRDFGRLGCIEKDCKFFLGFKCATLPHVVKHRVDDQPLSLCYGDKTASGKCWCDICEKEINLEKWFYTSKDHRGSLHIKCVLGDLTSLMPSSTIEYYRKWYAVVLNDSVTRPFCSLCKSRCIYPIILKLLGTSDTYFCCVLCVHLK